MKDEKEIGIIIIHVYTENTFEKISSTFIVIFGKEEEEEEEEKNSDGNDWSRNIFDKKTAEKPNHVFFIFIQAHQHWHQFFQRKNTNGKHSNEKYDESISNDTN